jgi:hypothetical protein
MRKIVSQSIEIGRVGDPVQILAWAQLRPKIYAYRNTQAPEANDYYVGLTFYLFQVFPNPMREFIFTDITPSDANNGLILVFR